VVASVVPGLVKDQVQIAELIPTSADAANRYPAKPARRAVCAQSAAQNVEDSRQNKIDVSSGLSIVLDGKSSSDLSIPVSSDALWNSRKDLVTLAASAAAKAMAHTDFAAMKRAIGVSQRASRDVRRIE